MRWRVLLAGLAAIATAVVLVSASAVDASAAPTPPTVVSGTVLYTDSGGSTHAARSVTVQILDADGTAGGGTVLATTSADATGHYTATVPSVRADGTTATQLVVRAQAASTGFAIHPDGSATTYAMASTAQAATGNPVTVNLTAGKTAVNEQAFAVADTLVTAMAYTRRINGGSLFPTLSVDFPTTAATSQFHVGVTPPVMDLLGSDAFDWDVILHEYGHFVADQFGFFDAGVSGSHSFGTNDGEPPATKQTGVDLAWNEGWATFFAIMAENVENVAALKIPNAGDSAYDDVEPTGTLHYDLAAANTGDAVGEDDEGSVARTLWHFFSDAKLAIPDTTLVATLRTSSPTDLSDAVKALLPVAHAASFDDSVTTDAAAEQHAEDFACVLTDEKVSPKITAPDNNTMAKADTPPAITWDPDGAGPSNRLNSFTVQFWSPNYDKLIFESPAQTATTYTPSMDDWKNKILGGTDKNSKYPAELNVVVKGTGTSAPATGPYKSCPITLTIKRVDLAFAIDTTGSMSPYISSVVASAQDVVNTLSSDGVDYRIAVTDYKDVDSDPTAAPGCPPDPYAAETDLPFSTTPADIQASLASLTGIVGGGCDTPEDVYSGVEQSLGLPWRPGVTKVVIQLGDAAGHDPEAHSGFTLAKVAADAAAVDPALVFSIMIGSDPSAHAFDQALAQATGGQAIDATADPSQAGPAIVSAVEAIDALPTADAGGPYTGVTGTPVNFSADGSIAPAGSIVKYEWDFTGTGNFVTVPGPDTTFTYSSPYSGPATLRVTDSNGHTAEATAQVNVTAAAPAAITVDQTVHATEEVSASPITAPALTTSSGGELVLAFVSADGPPRRMQQVTQVTGGGLSWTKAVSADSVVGTGTAEVWQAFATGPLTKARITARLRYQPWDGSITVMTFRGAASAVGVVAADGARSGAASVALTTTGPGSLILAAGHDWSNAVAQSPLSGQDLLFQDLDQHVNDTYWVQRVPVVADAGTNVIIGETAPVTDRWELAAVEVRTAS